MLCVHSLFQRCHVFSILLIRNFHASLNILNYQSRRRSNYCLRMWTIDYWLDEQIRKKYLGAMWIWIRIWMEIWIWILFKRTLTYFLTFDIHWVKYGFKNLNFASKIFFKLTFKSNILSFLCLFFLFLSIDRSLLFPAIFLISVGGVPLRIVNMPIANLFPKKRSTIITLYSGAFSASSITFAIVKYMYDVGTSYYYSVLIIFILSCVCFFDTFFLLPSFGIQDEDSSLSQESINDQINPANLREIFKKKHFENKTPVKLEKFSCITSPSADGKDLSFSYLANIYAKDCDFSKRPETKTGDGASSVSKPISLKQSLLSLSFILHQWWFAWIITYITLFIDSLHLWIKRIDFENKLADTIVIVYCLSQALGLVVAPFAGFWMDHQVNKATKVKDPIKRAVKTAQSAFFPMLFTSCTLLGSVLCKFFDNLTAVYTSMVFLLFLRSFLVAVGSAFLRVR